MGNLQKKDSNNVEMKNIENFRVPKGANLEFGLHESNSSDDENEDIEGGQPKFREDGILTFYMRLKMYLGSLEDRFNEFLSNYSKTIKLRDILTYLALLLMLVIVSINNVLNTRLTKQLDLYSFVISETLYPALFVAISLVLIWAEKVSKMLRTADSARINWKLFLFLAFLDALSVLMSIFPVLYLSGHLYLILSQFLAPVNMLFSMWILQSRYTQQHVVGGILLILACIVALLAPTDVDVENAKKSVSEDGGDILIFGNITWSSETVIWSVITVLSLLPKALSNIYKEKYTTMYRLNIINLNGMIAVFQLPLAALMLLVIMIPFPFTKTFIEPQYFGLFVENSYKALIGDCPLYEPWKLQSDINSTLIISNTTGVYDELYCNYDNLSLFFGYVFVNFLYNTLFLGIIKHVSSNVAVFWTVLAIFLTEIGYNWEWLAGPAYNTLTNFDVFVLVIALIGVATFQLSRRPETPLWHDQKK